eukprot:SAG11_NODE_2740_length_3022_cov_2.199795_1_plen_75_part_00
MARGRLPIILYGEGTYGYPPKPHQPYFVRNRREAVITSGDTAIFDSVDAITVGLTVHAVGRVEVRAQFIVAVVE